MSTAILTTGREVWARINAPTEKEAIRLATVRAKQIQKTFPGDIFTVTIETNGVSKFAKTISPVTA